MKRRALTPAELEDAQRLRQIWDTRKVELQLSQEEMAYRCGWKTQAAFSQYLLGRIPLNLKALLAISNVLTVDPAAISPRLASLMKASGPQIREELSAYPQTPAISKDDREWLDMLHQLSTEQRQAMKSAVAALVRANKKRKRLGK